MPKHIIPNEAQALISLINKHLARINRNNHSIIKNFQDALCTALNNHTQQTGYVWKKEVKMKAMQGIAATLLTTVNDSVDILGTGKKGHPIYIIELDASRADQVAKKILSRMALLGLQNDIVYIAMMYPDTQNGLSQCEKYIKYGRAILQSVNPRSELYGLYLDPKVPNIKVI